MSKGNALPQGWFWKKLENVAEIILGQSPPSSSYNDTGKGLPFYQGKTEFGETYPSPRKWCTSPKKIAEKGDILISVRAPVGPTNICPEKSCIGRGLAAIRGMNGVSPFFIFYFLRTIEKDLAEQGTGTTFSAITGSQLRAIDVPLPPLPEQQRIVEKIEELFTQLDAGVAELQQAKRRLKQNRQSVLKAAVEGDLTREWRGAHKDSIQPASELLKRILIERRATWEEGRGKEYQESAAPDAKNLHVLPEGWVWTSFDSLLIHLKNGYFEGIPASSPPGIPLLRISAVRPMVVSYDSLRYARKVTSKQIDTYKIQWGDLLFTRYNGNPHLVGACGMVRHVQDSVLYPDKLIRGQVPLSFVRPDYLEIYFATRTARNFINFKIKSTAGQNGISGGDLKSIPVILPPLDEQNAIIDKVQRRLSIADEIEKELDEALRRAQHLRRSILKRAFEGRLVRD